MKSVRFTVPQRIAYHWVTMIQGEVDELLDAKWRHTICKLVGEDTQLPYVAHLWEFNNSSILALLYGHKFLWCEVLVWNSTLDVHVEVAQEGITLLVHQYVLRRDRRIYLFKILQSQHEPYNHVPDNVFVKLRKVGKLAVQVADVR
jgi:hypothetical protein